MTLKPHKLGANQKESAKNSPKKARNFSQSRDVRESRSARQEKFGRPLHTTFGMTEKKINLSEQRTPLLLTEHIVSGKKPVRFTLKHPVAQKVSLAGVFNNWEPNQINLEQRADHTWQTEVHLSPGIYEYRYIVDGKWSDDPQAARFATNPFGSRNAVLKVV